MTRTHRFPLLLTVFALMTACGGADPAAGQRKPRAAKPQAAVGATEARTLFDSLCFTCHGTAGHGDGPGAAALDPKPRSFADVAWQDSVTDAHIGRAIVYGGTGVQKSAMMPANPQLKGKTEVIAALVKIVRGFRGK